MAEGMNPVTLAGLRAEYEQRKAAGECPSDIAWEVVCEHTTPMPYEPLEALAREAYPDKTVRQIINEHADCEPASDGAILQSALMHWLQGDDEDFVDEAE